MKHDHEIFERSEFQDIPLLKKLSSAFWRKRQVFSTPTQVEVDRETAAILYSFAMAEKVDGNVCLSD